MALVCSRSTNLCWMARSLTVMALRSLKSFKLGAARKVLIAWLCNSPEVEALPASTSASAVWRARVTLGPAFAPEDGHLLNGFHRRPAMVLLRETAGRGRVFFGNNLDLVAVIAKNETWLSGPVERLARLLRHQQLSCAACQQQKMDCKFPHRFSPCHIRLIVSP